MLVYHVLYPILMYGIMRIGTRYVGNADWIYEQDVSFSPILMSWYVAAYKIFYG